MLISTLKVCLFGAVKLAENADPGKYFYPRFGIGLDSCSLFQLRNFGWVEMLLFLEYTLVHQCILIIRKNYLSSW